MALQNAIFQRKGIFSLILVNVMMFIGMIQGIDDCRMLEFKPGIEGSSLFNHVIKTHLALSQDDGQLLCYIEDECMSINFGPGDSGEHVCELSDSDHDLHPEDLKSRHGFIYRPTKIPLGEDPANPGDSCKHILESGSSAEDREYWIDPDHSGNPTVT